MLLRTLKEYAEERMLTPLPTLYAMTPIRYIIELDGAGRPLSRSPTDTADATARELKRGVRRAAPEVVRAAGTKPFLLADTGEYGLGLAPDSESQSRADARHAAFRELLHSCAAVVRSPSLDAVEKFYDAGGVTLLDLPVGFDAGAKLTFRVHLADGAVIPIDLPSIQAFWAGLNDPRLSGAAVMQCIICGQQRPVVDSLQAKVKGVRGGNAVGTSIISANAVAFESYGLERSHIAPTCADCGEKFTRAINDLLAKDESRLYVGGTTFACWTRKPVEYSFASMISDPQPEAVRDLIDAVRSGKPFTSDDTEAFYAVALSGSGGRTVIRDWIDTTVGAAAATLARWFLLQEIVDPYGEPHRPLGIYALAAATVRKVDDASPTLPRALLHAALTGTPLPAGVAFEAVRRNRAEQTITRPRAALIKLVLLSQAPRPTEDYMVALEPDHPDIAYQLGRLLSVLEDIQRAALPGVNATIIDRFFGTASSAPASVFARLLRGAQPHLARLERDRRGAYVALQIGLEEILDRIPGRTAFPTTLSLPQQALFSLGYYHQRAYARAEAARRRAAASATTDAAQQAPEDQS